MKNILVKPKTEKQLQDLEIFLDKMDISYVSSEIDENTLTDLEKKAIDEALKDVAENNTFTDLEAKEILKNRHPKYF